MHAEAVVCASSYLTKSNRSVPGDMRVGTITSTGLTQIGSFLEYLRFESTRIECMLISISSRLLLFLLSRDLLVATTATYRPAIVPIVVEGLSLLASHAVTTSASGSEPLWIPATSFSRAVLVLSS